MLRHVYVCLQAGTPDDGCLETSVQFARGYGAWLSGLYIREPAPPPYPPLADPLLPSFPSAEMMQEYRRESEDHERRQDALEAATVQRFSETCRSAGIGHRMHVRTGDPKSEIPAGVKTADLVIVGRGQREDSPLGSVSGWLVRHLARPVLLAGRPLHGVKRVLVAYDGSHGAERALSLAADIASRWRDHGVRVHLLHARRVGEPQDHGIAIAEHYLDVYEIERETHQHIGLAGDVIPETAERIGADLVVMGAYGHSLVREVLLGSTTQAVIARWRGPLLLWR